MLYIYIYIHIYIYMYIYTYVYMIGKLERIGSLFGVNTFCFKEKRGKWKIQQQNVGFEAEQVGIRRYLTNTLVYCICTYQNT